MSSLRNFVVIVLLAGVLGVVYFAINKGPKAAERSELAPPWATTQDNAPPTVTSPPGSGGLPGFPPGSALPGTSISSSPPTVTLPPAPSSPSVPAPVALQPGAPTTVAASASPFPSIGPPLRTTPAEGTPPGAGPAGTAAFPSPAAPSATITGVGPIPSPTDLAPASALVAQLPGGNPASPTVILGPPGSSPQTVYPAGTPGATPPAGGPMGTAAPASYFQTAPGSAIGAAAPASGTTPPSMASAPPAGPAQYGPEFLAVMPLAKSKLEAGQLAEAHLDLSKYYTTSRLSQEEWRVTADLLDRLAGSVLYSREHLLEPAYRVQPGDTLERIAMSASVPLELLAKINGIRDTRQLVPGQEIKVVRGPFEAVVDLGRYEMTLLVGGRYAGRFPIGIGRDRASLEGVFVVRDKKTNPIYFGPDRVIAADDPTNPLGERLLDLGNQVGIHGTDNPKNLGASDGRGTIRLSQRDVEDVYDILSIGSRVTIRR